MTNSTTLVRTATSFLLAMKEAFGYEKAMALWDDMRASVGDELAGDVLFGLMAPRENSCFIRLNVKRANFTVPPPFPGSSYLPSYPNKIGAIKAIRNISGMGLKESKDAVEASEHQDVKIEFKIIDDASRPNQIDNFFDEMYQFGYAVR